MVHLLIAPLFARTYDPFGGTLHISGSGSSLYGFAGTQGGVGGLLYINGRYFDPHTGRFLSPGGNFDPRRPGTLNGYVVSGLMANPIMALLPVLTVFHWRKRRNGKSINRTDLFLLGLFLLAGLSACSGEGAPTILPNPGEVETGAPSSQPPISTPTSAPTPVAPSPTSISQPTVGVVVCPVPVTASPTAPPTTTATPTHTPPPTNTPTPLPYPGTLPPGVSNSTFEKYQTILNDLSMANEREVGNGSLKDEVLMAIIIYAELKALPPDHDAFREALEVLSWQYNSDGYHYSVDYSRMCNGSCDSYELELKWLQEMEAFRRSSASEMLVSWRNYLTYGQQTQVTPQYTNSDIPANSHVWGNYYEGTPMYNYIRDGGYERREAADWFNGVPFNALYELTRFIVMSGAQNLACRAVKCGGF